MEYSFDICNSYAWKHWHWCIQVFILSFKYFTLNSLHDFESSQLNRQRKSQDLDLWVAVIFRCSSLARKWTIKTAALSDLKSYSRFQKGVAKFPSRSMKVVSVEMKTEKKFSNKFLCTKSHRNEVYFFTISTFFFFNSLQI